MKQQYQIFSNPSFIPLSKDYKQINFSRYPYISQLNVDNRNISSTNSFNQPVIMTSFGQYFQMKYDQKQQINLQNCGIQQRYGNEFPIPKQNYKQNIQQINSLKMNQQILLQKNQKTLEQYNIQTQQLEQKQQEKQQKQQENYLQVLSDSEKSVLSESKIEDSILPPFKNLIDINNPQPNDYQILTQQKDISQNTNQKNAQLNKSLKVENIEKFVKQQQQNQMQNQNLLTVPIAKLNLFTNQQPETALISTTTSIHNTILEQKLNQKDVEVKTQREKQELGNILNKIDQILKNVAPLTRQKHESNQKFLFQQRHTDYIPTSQQNILKNNYANCQNSLPQTNQNQNELQLLQDNLLSDKGNKYLSAQENKEVMKQFKFQNPISQINNDHQKKNNLEKQSQLEINQRQTSYIPSNNNQFFHFNQNLVLSNHQKNNQNLNNQITLHQYSQTTKNQEYLESAQFSTKQDIRNKFYVMAVKFKLKVLPHIQSKIIISDLFEEVIKQNIPPEQWESFLQLKMQKFQN